MTQPEPRKLPPGIDAPPATLRGGEEPRLALPPHLRQAIADHVTAHYPREACGVIAGQPGWATIFCPTAAHVIGLANVDPQPTLRYRFDPAQQMRVWDFIDMQGLDPLAVYHSHTLDGSTADPSPADIDAAVDPSILHLIVRVGRRGPVDWRLWHIVRWRDVPVSPIQLTYEID